METHCEENNSMSESTTPRSLSPSPSVTPSPGSVIGRPRKSPVWDYFEYDSTNQKSVCQVMISGGTSSSAESLCSTNRCGHALAGKFATNMKHHLKKAHPVVYEEVTVKEQAMVEKKLHSKKPRKSASHYRSQMTIGEAFQQKYDTKSHRCQFITRKLAIFIGSTSVPNSLVENMEFRSLLEAMDPRYPVPGRTLIGKEIDKVLLDMKTNIQAFISKAPKVSLCADIWTKKGMSSSYLGVTAHFFTQHDHMRHRVTLAVRRLHHPHTAETIRDIIDEVLTEWNIPLRKVRAIITDNASNMIKAFRLQLEHTESEESETETEDEKSEDIPEDWGEEEEDFEDRELDHEVTFKFYCKRISCFTHTLQLVVHKFSEVKSFSETLKRMQTLVKKVNKSSKATEMLLSRAHKKLVGNCPTRWSSTYLMIKRLLDVRMPLTSVLEELEWDNLAISDWKVLENIHKLMNPFALYTSLSSGEDYTTISSVIPIIMELNLHLDEMKKVPEMVEVSNVLQSELKRRFRRCTDPGDPNHDPLFLMATMLDPRYKVLLNPIQLESSKKEVLKEVKEFAGSNGNSGSPSSTASPAHLVDLEESKEHSPKRFCHLSRLLQEKVKEGIEKVAQKPPGQQELDHYLLNVHHYPDDNDAFKFWIEERATYPLLSSVAVEILTITASSAPVERVFSTAGDSTVGKRNRLAYKNLEREVLLRKNKDYL